MGVKGDIEIYESCRVDPMDREVGTWSEKFRPEASIDRYDARD